MLSAAELQQRVRAREWIFSTDPSLIAASFAAVSVLISLIHLFRHLRTYTMPSIQQWIIRLIVICPVYAMSSATAMFLGSDKGMYVQFIRDLYEAFAVYSLMNLVMAYAGGETDCVYAIENEPAIRLPCPLCFMSPRPRDAKLLRFCQRGVLQFVLVKPVVTLLDVITFSAGVYSNVGYQVVEAFVYNLSYGLALYSLFVFYGATKTHLHRFRPACKIITVKSLIVMCFYQGLAARMARLPENELFLWTNLLLSVEMLFFSTAFTVAFPTSEFLLGIPDRHVLSNIKDIFTVKDLYEGFDYNFRPAYRDYSLQRQEGEAPEMVRLRTFFVGNVGVTGNVALEAAERYRGRSKRLAFNSLLRGTRPVSAGLRHKYSSDSYSDGDGDEEIDLGGVQEDENSLSIGVSAAAGAGAVEQSPLHKPPSPLHKPPSPSRRQEIRVAVPLLAPPRSAEEEWGEFNEA